MKCFFTYTGLRLKSVLKILPAMCVMTLLLCLSLGGMLYLQSSRSAQLAEGDESQRAGVGVVGIDSSGYLGALFPMLKNMDSSSQEVDFIQYDTREEAADAIRREEIAAAIVIPDGIVSQLLAGEQAKMTLLFSGSSAGIQALILRELSAEISTILGSMNSAGNTLEEYYKQSGTSDPDVIANAQTELLLTAVQDMIHRNQMFLVCYVSSEMQLSIESFYLVSMVLLLILLIGVMCAGSFIRSDYSLPRLLKLRRLGAVRQIISEYVSLTALLVCLAAIFLPLIGFALSRMPITFSAFGLTPSGFMKGFLLFAVRTFPVILLAAALDLMLYELADDLITGVLLQFLTMISLAYVSGVFYTAQTMPKVLKNIQPFLPTGQALLYLQRTAKGRSMDMTHLGFVLAWAMVFLAVTCVLRARRVSGKGGAR